VRRKTKKALKMTGDHAAVALQLLIEEGRIAAADVARALQRRDKLMRELRDRLSALENLALPAARRLASAGRKAVRRSAPRARKAISRAQKLARSAQGHYLAAIRGLSGEAKAKIKAIREKSGVRAAIRAARKMAG
jgi:aminopeptidase N